MSVHIAIFSYAKDYEHWQMTQNAVDSVLGSLLPGTEARIVVHETAQKLPEAPKPWRQSMGTVVIDESGRFLWGGVMHQHPVMRNCRAHCTDMVGECGQLRVGPYSVRKTPRKAIPVSFGGAIEYKGAEVIQVDEFNYGRECNRAWKDMGSAEWLLILNNDVICHKGAIEAMIETGYKSVSPVSPAYNTQSDITEPEEGYLIGRNVAGWAIMTHKDVLDAIGGYDEDFPFFHVDCAYAMQLKNKGIAHCVTPKSKITHLFSKTAAGFEHKDWLEASTKMFYTKYPKEWDEKITGFHSAYWTWEELFPNVHKDTPVHAPCTEIKNEQKPIKKRGRKKSVDKRNNV